MNPIVQRIEREGVKIEKKPNNSRFSYTTVREVITCDDSIDINEPTSMYSLAHELGHWQQEQLKNWNIIYLFHLLHSVPHFLSIFFYPIILFSEADAWRRAKKICKEENVSLKGFHKFALTCYLSYVNAGFKKVGILISKFLEVAVIAVFLSYFLSMDTGATWGSNITISFALLSDVFKLCLCFCILISLLVYIVRLLRMYKGSVALIVETDEGTEELGIDEVLTVYKGYVTGVLESKFDENN